MHGFFKEKCAAYSTVKCLVIILSLLPMYNLFGSSMPPLGIVMVSLTENYLWSLFSWFQEIEEDANNIINSTNISWVLNQPLLQSTTHFSSFVPYFPFLVNSRRSPHDPIGTRKSEIPYLRQILSAQYFSWHVSMPQTVRQRTNKVLLVYVPFCSDFIFLHCFVQLRL